MAERNGRIEKAFVRYCNRVGRLSSGQPSEELRYAVDFLGWDTVPKRVLAAAKVSMILSFMILLAAIVVAASAGFSPMPLVFALPLSVLVFFLMTEWPKSLAKQKATDALNSAPYLVTQIAVSLKQNPNLENALGFVADHNDGKIVKDIRKSLWLMWTGVVKSPYEALRDVAKKWSRHSLGFQRSVQLIISSFQEQNLKGKVETLDKAINVMLDDITEKMNEYALSLHIPTLILFSIGTIVPLMVISLFPIVSFFGFQVSPMTITVFLFATLMGCYVYSDVVLRKRPATVMSVIEVPPAPVSVAPMAVAAMVLISIPSMLFVLRELGVALFGPMAWMADTLGGLALTWGIGIGAAFYAYRTSSGVRARMKKVRELESQFIDGLYHLKNRLSDGRPIESALENTRDLLGNLPIAEFFGRLVNRMKRRSMSLSEAMEAENPESKLMVFVFKLITDSLKEGRKAAATTAEVVHQYLMRMKGIEKELNTMLNKPLSMMKATILFFAPMVCGIIVVLFEMITRTIAKTQGEFVTGFGVNSFFLMPVMNSAALSLVVGVYSLALNYVLLRYITRVQSGMDTSAFRYELARSLPVTLIVFTATLIISRFLLLR